MSTLTSSLIVKLIDQVSAPGRQMTNVVKGLGQAFTGLSGKGMMAGLSAAIKRNNAQIETMKGRLVAATAMGYALNRALGAPIRAAMEFESAMADVKKVVDFDDLPDFKRFQQDVLDLTTRIPMAGRELSAIVAEAGQSGVAKNDLIQFTEMAAKVGVAFDISAQQAGEALAKLKTGLALSIEDTGKLADAMNHLSNSQASKASDVLDVVRRVGAMGKQYGFRPQEVAAFGSAMVAAGAQTEVAATSFQNMGRALVKGENATKRQRSAYSRLGLDARKVAINMQKDAVGTTIDVMERIGKLPAHLRASVSSSLFGDEARALGPLLTNLDLLRRSIKMVADEREYAGSSEKEYISRSATFANTVQLMKNRIERMGIAIGSVLMPPLSDLLGMIAPIVDKMTEWAQAHPELVKYAIMATAALISFRVAAIGVQAAALFAKGGVLELARAMLGIAMFGGKGIAAPFMHLARGLGKIRKDMIIVNAMGKTGLFSRKAIVGGNLAAIGKGLLAMVNPLRLIGPLVAGIGVALKAAFIATGIGAVIAGIAAAGLWIYNNWSGLSAMFSSFASTLAQRFPKAAQAVGWVVDKVKALWSWVSNLLGPIDATEKQWSGWGVAAANAVGDIIDKIAAMPARIIAFAGELLAAGGALIQSLWDGMVQKFDQLIEWVKGIPGRIVSAIGNIDLSSVIKMPSWLGGGGAPVPSGGGIEARASGGPISAGRPYLVGENGPELITAGRDGYVHNASDTRQMMGGGRSVAGGASGGVTVNLGGLSVSISGVPDPHAIVDQVISELQSRIGSAMTGIQADIGYTS